MWTRTVLIKSIISANILAGGDFNMANYERAWGLFFNYTLLNNYNLELPYTM